MKDIAQALAEYEAKHGPIETITIIKRDPNALARRLLRAFIPADERDALAAGRRKEAASRVNPVRGAKGMPVCHQ